MGMLGRGSLAVGVSVQESERPLLFYLANGRGMSGMIGERRSRISTRWGEMNHSRCKAV